MKHALPLLCLLFFANGLFAQNPTVLLRGSVTDSEGQPLDYYNLIITRAQDSTTLGGSCFYKAPFEYEITRASDEQLLVLFTSLGYKDQYRALHLTGTTIELEPVKLEAETIGEVVIRPQTITKEGAKTIVQVEGTVLQNMATVADILQRAPMVTANEDGLELLGKGTPLIYIDGKISDYAAVQQLQPTQIVSMSIDRNPSARYDATYKSVLKITTNRRREGISGQVHNTSRLGRHYSNTTGAHLQVNKGKWYNYLGGNFYFLNQLNRDVSEDLVSYNGYELLNHTNNRYRYKQGDYDIDYNSLVRISDRHSLSWQYKFSNEFPVSGSKYSQEESIVENGVSSKFYTNKTEDFKYPAHKANLQYTFDISDDQKLETTVDYGHLFYQKDQTIERRNGEGTPSDLTTASCSTTNVFSTLVEYSFKLWKTDFVVGSRYGLLQTNSKSRYDTETTPTHSRNDVVAVFATVERSYGKWGYDLGLRGEFSKDDISANSTSVRNQWNNYLFPSASVQTNGLLPHVDLSLSYRASITYPRLVELNPAKSYYNSISTGTGNPLLKPCITHSAEFSATLWDDLILTTSYNYDKDAIINTGVLSEDRKNILFTYVNIPKSHDFMLAASYSKQWKKFSLSLDTQILFPYVKLPYMESDRINRMTSYMGAVNFDWNLTPTTVFSGGFGAESRSQWLMTDCSAIYNLAFSISQQLFKKRLSVILSGTDLLHRAINDWGDCFGYYTSSQRNSYDTRAVRLTLRYNFNNDKNRARKGINDSIYDRVN